MTLKVTGLVAGLALLGFAPQASAAIVTVTYTGVVTSNSETHTGVTTSGDLVGQSYVATYVFNTSLGYTVSSPTINYAQGGTGYESPPYASPLLSATLAINGINVPGVFMGSNDQIFGQTKGGAGQYSYQFHRASYYTASFFQPSGSLVNYVENHDGALPASITTPFTYSLGPNDTGYAQFYLYFGTFNYNTYSYSDEVSISARLLTLTETLGNGTVVAAVPEPSTWAMMLIGFAGIGTMTWRRRRSSARTA